MCMWSGQQKPCMDYGDITFVLPSSLKLNLKLIKLIKSQINTFFPTVD